MKYTDYIEINETFQYSINLQFDINNIEKIKEYIPTNDSCEIMEYYLDSIFGNFNKSTTLIGPYGKGKSHLLLVLLTLLNDYNEEDEDVLNGLLEKIKFINENVYNKFKEIRLHKLKYMPVIINSNYNNMNQAFLLALVEALEREEINDLVLNTYFDVALEIIQNWENNEDPEAIEKFETCLNKEDITLNELKNKLKMYDDEGYNVFKSVYKCVMLGMEFNPLINTDIVKYYKDANYNICKHGYNGMLIIFDEFSKFLEYVGNENMMKDLKILQDFAELSSRTGKKEQIIFSCVTHKTINEYIKNLKEDKVNAFKTVEGRFKEIYFNRSMEQNYEIISQTINKKPSFDTFFEEYYQKNKLFYDEIKNEFSFCDIENCKKILFKGCYPLNPITVYAVINLSEKIAQNERTLFTFLTDDDITSLKYYIRNNESNELFNIDRIYDYFKNIFKKERDQLIKEVWIKAENAINKTKDLYERKILKALAIIYMISDFETLAPNDATIRLSLNIEEQIYNDKIKSLIDRGIIKVKKSTKNYDFSSVYNKEVLKEIEKIVDTKFTVISEKDTLNKIADLGYVIPRRYNQTYKMTRFFKNIFLTEEEILNLKSFKILKQKSNSDGIIINLIRYKKDIEKIKNKIEELNDRSTVIRIPKTIISQELQLALKEYEAIEYIRKVENLDEELFSELKLIEEENIELIQNEINKKFNSNDIEVNYYVGKEKIKNHNLSSIVSKICEELYNETPIINNEMVNKNEISAPIYKARCVVIDTILNNDKSLIESPTSAEATIYKAVYEKKENEDIKNIIKIIKDFIKKAEKTGKRAFEQLLDTLYSEPYGLRKGLLPILTAIAMEEYSENIILYYQNKEIDIDSNSISKIIDEPDKYFIYVEKGTAAKEKFIMKIMPLYNVNITSNYRLNIKNLVLAMKKWVLSLPRIVRELSATNDIITEQSYIKIKNELMKSDLNNNEFLFKTIPDYFETNEYDDLFESLCDLKIKLDNYLKNYSELLIYKFKELFEHNSKTNLNTLLRNWYKNIDDKIKNTVIKLEIKRLFEYIESLDTYNENEIIHNISYIVVGRYIEDWQDQTYTEFFNNIENFMSEIKNVNIDEEQHQEMVVISDGDKEIKKYINASEISSLGSTLKNNIEDSIDEYGDSISESEKIKILLQIIKKYI